MTRDDLARIYDDLPRHRQAYFLASLVHELTICARGLYSDKPQVVNSEAHSGIGRINEIQHRLATYIMHVLDDKPDRPSGRGIVDGILDWVRSTPIEHAVQDCLERAISQP